MDEARVELDPKREAARGLSALACAFTIWGVLPIYIRALSPVPALQITVHRMVFCCLFMLGFLQARGVMYEVRVALADPAVRKRLIWSSLLISVNWLGFVWAIGQNRTVEASLGYYINPLVNVLLGVVVLRERLRPQQWLAVACAAVGVAYLTWYAHALPWIALMLAGSFGAYGLIRKTVAVDAMAGLASETLLTSPFAVAYMVYCELQGTGAFLSGDIGTLVMLALSGVLTALPLWMFAFGARRVPYSTVGLMQYIGPTLSLGVGVFLFHEPFSAGRAVGFAFIWAGCVIYARDSFKAR